MAPLADSSAASTALSAGLSPPAHAERVPSSVEKMNAAGILVPGTRNDAAGFHTIPVGAAGLGSEGFFGSFGWHEVTGTKLPGRGMETCRAVILMPVPSYRVEHPVRLSLTQKGLPAGEKAIPQAFCRTASWWAAWPGRLDVSRVIT